MLFSDAAAAAGSTGADRCCSTAASGPTGAQDGRSRTSRFLQKGGFAKHCTAGLGLLPAVAHQWHHLEITLGRFLLCAVWLFSLTLLGFTSRWNYTFVLH